jgi:anaerobic selenocysteine-containing dehydrogenase
MADVVLPSTTWLEQSGHYMNSSGIIQSAAKSLQAPDEIFSIGETLPKLAKEMGVKLTGDCHATLHHRIAPVTLDK